MDAFENLVAEIFWKEGYWTQTSFKVDLSKEEKRRLGNPSMPRPEIDVLAYKGSGNVLKIIECKSFIDSRGVRLRDVDGTDADGAKRYKLFRNDELRMIVFDRLRTELSKRGACRDDVKMTLCLACGRIATDRDRSQLQSYFKENGWELFDEQWLVSRLRAMADIGYENQVATVVAKLLLRGKLPDRE